MKKSCEKIINKSKIKLKEVFNADLNAKQIAINFTVGILVGLLVPMGLQTVGVIALCALFRLNFFIVVFATLITNPFTFVFIYYSAFKVGDFFIHSGIAWDTINSIINNPEYESILNLSLKSIKVIYSGLVIEALILAPITYIIVYQIAEYIKKNNNNLNTSDLSNR